LCVSERVEILDALPDLDALELLDTSGCASRGLEGISSSEAQRIETGADADAAPKVRKSSRRQMLSESVDAL
jgi:hypothetical protein